MDFFYKSLNAVLVIVLLYLCALYMRHKDFLKEEHSMVLAKIVTELCLPAMIFISVSKSSFEFKQLEPAFVILGLEIACIALAWWISCLLKLSNAQTGAVVLCSAFGSSAFLGYSFIMSVFPGQSVALDEGVLISEVGVGYPIYILAPMLASRFGTAGSKENGIYRKIVLDFLKSPVFFSLILGILWSVFKLPTGDHGFLGPFFKLFKDLSSALTPLAILSIGLMFEVPKIKSILIPFIIVVLIKLIFQPVAANVLSVSFGFSDLWREILVILSAMPPAVLGVVFLKRYGADASLASALVIAVTLVSVITLTGMALLIH